MFQVDMTGIPYPVSVHFTRHKVGVEHFVTTSRPDLTGKPRSIDDTVNHRMVCNAQALITMARRRLCSNAADETRQVMLAVRPAVGAVFVEEGLGAAMKAAMVPDCEYRGGYCHEFKTCGLYPRKA